MDWRAKLAAEGLPEAPEGEIAEARWRARDDDWFIRIEGKGWFWLESKQRRSKANWMPSVYGP